MHIASPEKIASVANVIKLIKTIRSEETRPPKFLVGESSFRSAIEEAMKSIDDGPAIEKTLPTPPSVAAAAAASARTDARIEWATGVLDRLKRPPMTSGQLETLKYLDNMNSDDVQFKGKFMTAMRIPVPSRRTPAPLATARSPIQNEQRYAWAMKLFQNRKLPPMTQSQKFILSIQDSLHSSDSTFRKSFIKAVGIQPPSRAERQSIIKT